MGQEEILAATAAFGGRGLLADQSGQGGVDFQEDMRRRRAAIRGPVVYEDEELTF